MVPHFLKYSPLSGTPAPEPDSLWLEETEKGAYPLARRDEDGDGYHEVLRFAVELRAAFNPLLGRLSLANYFDERKYSAFPSLVAAHFLARHGAEALAGLKALAEARDLKGMNLYFRFLASGKADPLGEIRPYLHAFLNLIAVHSGYGVSDLVNAEKNPYGFSVTADGRWRVDCGNFVQFARASLRKIEGLSFSYIYMRGAEPGQSHVVLLVSDTEHRHLLVDNGSALSFKSEEPEKYLIDRFTARGYTTLAKGGSEWKPFAKHETFYPTP